MAVHVLPKHRARVRFPPLAYVDFLDDAVVLVNHVSRARPTGRRGKVLRLDLLAQHRYLDSLCSRSTSSMSGANFAG